MMQNEYCIPVPWKIWLVAGLFFLVTSITALLAGDAFTSPDETINAAAAHQFSMTGTVRMHDALPEDTGGVFRPRNGEVVRGYIVPSSYLSFPLLLGSIEKILPNVITVLVTPLLAALALVAAFALTRLLWNQEIASLVAVLLALTPGFLFFTIKGHWHNIAFISLLLLGLWFAANAVVRKNFWRMGFAGIFFGFGISLRLNELLWITALVVLLVWCARKVVTKNLLIVFFLTAALGLAPLLFLNTMTYGGPFSFGYTAALDTSAEELPHGTLTKFARLVIPVEADGALYRTNALWYGVELFPVFPLFASIGALWVLNKTQKIRRRKISLLAAAGLTLWFFWYYAGTPYYGAFTNSSQPIIGSSFVRYFLPIAVLALPFVASGMVYCANTRPPLRRPLLVLFIALFGLFSTHLVVFEKENGLKKYFQQDIPQITQAHRAIQAYTEKDALIIAGAKDKLFFPERLVMGYNVLEPQHLEILPRILGRYPIYYNDIAARDLQTIADTIDDYGYQLKQVGMIGQDPLYHIETLP